MKRKKGALMLSLDVIERQIVAGNFSGCWYLKHNDYL